MLDALAVALALGLVLPPRLQVVHDATPQGARVADIGCDHGQLSAALALSDRASAVFACDMSEAALKKTALTLERTQMGGRVLLRAGDGLNCLTAEDAVDSAVMAGLGVPRMINILREGFRVEVAATAAIRTLVLQPVTPHLSQLALLRAYLRRRSFQIVTETFSLSEARPYVTLTAVRGGTAPAPSESVALLGEAPPPLETRGYLAYLSQQRERLAKQLRGLQRARQRAAVARQCRRLSAQIRLLDSMLGCS